MKTMIKTLAVLMTGLLLILCAGCNGSSADNSDNSAASSAAGSKKAQTAATDASNKDSNTKVKIKVYYPDEAAEKLIPVTITVNENNKYAEAVERLVTGKAPQGAVVVMPKNTKVNSVKLDNKIATVDLSREFVKNFSGGSTGEVMLVSSIADTLTEFSEISAVQFTVEGKKLDTLGGHLDLTQPVQRNEKLLKK